MTVAVSVTAPKSAARGFKDLFCRAKAGKTVSECYHTICVARPVIADLRADMRGIPTAIALTNRSTEIQTVEVRLMGDGNVSDTDWQTVIIPPRTSTVVTIGPKYAKVPDTWADLFVEIRQGGRVERNALRAWNRAIWNSSFEMHSPNATMPDFWSVIDYSGKEDGSRLVHLAKLDDQFAVDGKYSLRIDPYTGNVANFTVCVFPASFRLDFHKKYRLTAFIRVPKGGDGKVCGGQDWGVLQPVGAPDARGWQRLERTFSTDHADWGFTLVLCNAGKTPVWFDNLSVSELQ
jgi:hypothetical protein